MKSLPALVLFAAGIAAFALSGSPQPQTVTASPVVVGSPPGELAALRSELDKANERITELNTLLGRATSELQLLAPCKTSTPKSNCAGGICPDCKCDPNDERKCIDGQCDLPSDLPPAANPGRWELRTFRTGWRGRQTSQQWVWVSPITTQGAATYRGGGCASCR